MLSSRHNNFSRRSLPWCIWAISCLIFLVVAVESIKVVNSGNHTYVVEDAAGRTLFEVGDIAFFVGGKWCVYKVETDEARSSGNEGEDDHWKLIPVYEKNIHGNEKALGPFIGAQVEWNCKVGHQLNNNDSDGDPSYETVTIVTSYKNIKSGIAVLFEVQWPDGASNTSLVGSHDANSAMSNYPSLLPSANILPNALSWHGSFTQSVREFSEGTQGGPTVFFNSVAANFDTVVVGSPWRSHWKSFSAGAKQNWAGKPGYWSPGTSGQITQLPANYTQSILLYQRNDGNGGITGTLDFWGRAMQRASKPKSGPWKLPDVTLKKIGYQTDNGAMYCFCHDRNCSQTLLNEIAYLKSQDVPMGYLSFQGAGASSGRGKAAPWCVDTWGVDGGLSDQYPMDVKTFQKALGLPLQLYAPYFCPNSPYFDSKDHPSKWKSIPSDPSLPGCQGFAFEDVQPSQSRAFYDWFFAKGIEAGMVSFEPDFLNQNYNCVPEFLQHATAAENWQQGMARAALAKNLTIQWCYASPTDVLASLEMPAVTNFRVSFDFCYGRSWDIGESSLLVWALGAAPSKDTLWSTDNNRTAIPGCPWTPDHEESAAELHVVLALMSKGPVGLSDAIGYTNATLLKQIITIDGTLLKPTKPLTAIDSTFRKHNHPVLASQSTDSSGGDGGYVYGTAGLGSSWYFVSFLLPSTFLVRLRDFWPPFDNQQHTFVYRRLGGGTECQNGKDAVLSGCVKIRRVPSVSNLSTAVFQAPAASVIEAGELSFAPMVTAVWQPCRESGWIMLGELGKYVPVSPSRFQKVECTKQGVSVSVVGAEGETVVLTALRPTTVFDETLIRGKTAGSRYTVVKKKVTIHSSDASSVNFVAFDDQPTLQEEW